MSHGYKLVFMCAGCLSIRPARSRCAHNKQRERMWIDPALPGQTQECQRAVVLANRHPQQETP